MTSAGPNVPDYEPGFAQAINLFWAVKGSQQATADKAGKASGKRGSVLAGKHMTAFEDLIRQVVSDAGIETDPEPGKKVFVPGFYRETKSWDVVLQYRGHILAIVEAKSQGSSLAGNFNNRVEEAIGQAADIWKSHERGLAVSGIRPWVGYLMVVEETADTIEQKFLRRSKAIPPGMIVDEVFDGLSYAERYAEAFRRLDQERMLDATCVAITRDADNYSYPNQWLSFNGFAAQLWGRCKHVQAVLG